MSITIRQLAAELGVSREAVRLQVQKLSAADIEKGKNRTTIITDAGADIIRDWFKTDATNSNNNTTSFNADEADIINENQIVVCENCEELEQQVTYLEQVVTNLQQVVTNLERDLEAKIQQTKLLSDNIADLRNTIELQINELQSKDKQISDLMQMLQAEQLMRGKILQLEEPKKKQKLFSIFSKKKDTEPQ